MASRCRKSSSGSDPARPRAITVLLLIGALMATACGPGDPADPQSDSVSRARSIEADRMRAALNEVVAALGGEELGVSSVDECYEGQRNYKVDLGYDYRCSLLVGVVIGLDGGFRTRMLELDATLRELGWRSSNGRWPGELVDSYWDLRAAESQDGQVPLHRLPGPFGIERDGIRLLFHYGNANDDRGLEGIDRAQQSTVWCCGPPYFENQELFDVARVAGQSSGNELVLISAEGHYYEQ